MTNSEEPTFDELMAEAGEQDGPHPDNPLACPDHFEVKHRDGKPAWCNKCGWNRGYPAQPAIKYGTPRERRT